MGGVVKGVTKAVKSVVGGVKKVVKGVASGVKKLATGVAKGLNKVTGGLLGKLGPIGTIAMGLLLPGIGSAFAGMWTSAATAATAYTGLGSGVINAVGAGMQWAAQAAGAISGGVGKITSGITSTIKSGLEYLGGNVMKGAEYLFKGAQEFVGIKNPTSISDIGKWVGQKAQALNPFKGTPTTDVQPGMFSSVETGAGVQNLAMSPVDPTKLGGYDMVTPMFDASGQSIGNALASPSQWAAEQAGGFSTSSLFPTSGAMSSPVTNNIIGGKSISGSTYLSPVGVTPGSAGIAATGSSMLDRILKAGGSLLSNMAANPMQTPMAAPYSAGSIGDEFASQRFGVGGQGASGGTFLTEQQRQQQMLLAQQLAQLG